VDGVNLQGTHAPDGPEDIGFPCWAGRNFIQTLAGEHRTPGCFEGYFLRNGLLSPNGLSGGFYQNTSSKVKDSTRETRARRMVDMMGIDYSLVKTLENNLTLPL
jgi:hypothetical protein